MEKNTPPTEYIRQGNRTKGTRRSIVFRGQYYRFPEQSSMTTVW